jgi:hypothetical protein
MIREKLLVKNKLILEPFRSYPSPGWFRAGQQGWIAAQGREGLGGGATEADVFNWGSILRWGWFTHI